MDPLCDELQRIWYEQIPISAHMGVEIVSFIDGQLIASAALEPNINVHGTAFAGSLYAVCALTGWGMMWLQLRRRALAGDIVIARAQIDYLKPVSEPIIARCEFDASLQKPRLQRLVHSGRANFPLTCTIAAAGFEAARFEAFYAVRLSRS